MVVLVGVLAVVLLDLEDRGVRVVGTIDAGLPAPGLPGSSWSQYVELLPAAAAVLLIGFVEGLAASSTYAQREGYEVDQDRDLTALGGANLGSGLLGGMVVAGSLSKTTVNAGAGARSQLSGVVGAALVGVTLVALDRLGDELAARGVRLVVAGALGSVRSVAEASGHPGPLRSGPATVDEAVALLGQADP